MTRNISTTATRSGGQIFTGIGALAAVVTIAALPVLLVWAAGNPLPTIGQWVGQAAREPGAALDHLVTAGTSRDDGTLFLQALTLTGWIAAALAAWAWLSFLVAFVTEFAAQLSARRAGRVVPHATRLPGMRMQQRAAAALVAAIIGILAAPTVASAAPTPAAPAAVTHTTPTSATAQAGDTGVATTHRVARGEGLLAIAERYGVPWQSIADANHGRPQPDGTSLQPGSTRVYPGWTLTIPGTTTQSSHSHADDHTTQSSTAAAYQVTRGDRLYDIAERFLGDGARYPEIAAENRHIERRDHRFPDHIEKGWRLTLPDDARDRGRTTHATGKVINGSPAPAEAKPDRPAPPPATSTNAAPPKANERPTAPPPTTAPTTGAKSNGTAEPTTAASPEPTAPSATAPSSHAPAEPTADAFSNTASTDDLLDNAMVMVSALAGAGLLSTLLLTTVLRRRRQQQQHRRPGRQLPHPQGGTTERVLRIAEEPADVDRLDAALRGLASALAGRDEDDQPDIVAVRLVDQTVTAVLNRPSPHPPAPWSATDDGHWTLPATAVPPLVDGQLAPLPTLVAVGSHRGEHLLVDLERFGSLTIGGDANRAAALLRYMASELACNTWSDDVEVVIAGFPAAEAELLVALNPDRMRAVSSIGEAVSRMRRRASTVRAALASAGVPDTFVGRSVDVGEAWPPQVLLVVEPADDDLAALAELQQDLSDGVRCAVAVASTSPAVTQDATLIVDADGALTMSSPWLWASTTAAGLPVPELEPLAEIMQQARAAADVPAPSAPEPEAWAAGADSTGALLRLFDSVEAPPPGADDDSWDRLLPDDAANDRAAAPTRPEPIVALPQITLPSPPARRRVEAAVRQRRRQVDPHLDTDLRAWRDQDPHRPRIGVLGPVTVDAPGPAPDQRRRFHAEIIVYLAQRGVRGATAEQFTEALWPSPGQPIKDASRRVAISRARRWLGHSVDDREWLPEMGAERLYRLNEGVLLDWHLFRRLRTRGESHGPAGVRDLRSALELVRGVPLDGADRAYAAGARNPYTWLPESDIYPGHLTSGIVDTAHELAELYLDAGDTAGARWAVGQAWLADPHRGDDGPWRDLMRAAQMDGHAAEVRNLLSELMRAREAEVPEDLSKETYAWLRPLLPEVLAGSY